MADNTGLFGDGMMGGYGNNITAANIIRSRVKQPLYQAAMENADTGSIRATPPTPFESWLNESGQRLMNPTDTIAQGVQNFTQQDPVDMGMSLFGGGLGTIKTTQTAGELAQKLAQDRAMLPVSEHGLGLPAGNTAMDRANAMNRNTHAYHASKQDITGAFQPGYDDDLAFVTQSPEFANKWLGKGKYTQRTGEQAKQEIKSAEGVYRDIKSRNVNYDNKLEHLKGEEFNTEYDRRSALARVESINEFGTRGNPDQIHDTVYPLTVQSNKIFNPETDMDVMADFFKNNDIPPNLQELYAGGNYMMYETKPVVGYLKSKGYDSMRLRESTGDDYPTIAVFNPESVRSKFAAQDPWRRNAAIAALTGTAAPDLMAGENDKLVNALRSK